MALDYVTPKWMSLHSKKPARRRVLGRGKTTLESILVEAEATEQSHKIPMNTGFFGF
jgi:hypothetical protein